MATTEGVSLLAVLAAREIPLAVYPLKSPYSEIEIQRVDLSAHFAFPGARELIHIAVSPTRMLDERIYDLIDERISAYGFFDRPKILEFTRIDPGIQELLGQIKSVALLSRADLAGLGRSQSVMSYLRRLLTSSFSFSILNPYVFRGPVTGSRQFFGREDEIATLRSQTQRSFVISGARRSGKTSLMIETKRRLDASPQSEEIVIYLTFENCRSIADLPRVVLKALPSENDDYTRLANSGRWKHPQNLPLLVDNLSRYLKTCRKTAHTVRFFFDEYDRVLNLERGVAKGGLSGVCREILAAQKSREGKKSERLPKVQFAFAGSPLLYAELLSESSPIYNFATKLQLHNFDLKTLTTLITLPLRDLGIKVANAPLVAQTLLMITGGHPSTSQHLCSILVERLAVGESAEIGGEDVKRAGHDPEFLGEFADTIDRNISPLGRFILAQIAKTHRPLLDLDYFWRTGKAYDIRFDRAALGFELAGLADSGYLTVMAGSPTQGVSYTLAIPTVKQVYADFDPRELVPDMLAWRQCTETSS